MKLNKILISSIAALGLLCSACEDVLDVDAENTRDTDSFFQTPAQMEQALMGIYNGLLPLPEYYWLLGDVRADGTWSGETVESQQDYHDISSFNPNISTISTISDAWDDLYAIIARVNTFLTKTDGVTYTVDGVKEQQIGEARFLRALAYFDLVRYFGRVPLVLEPQTVAEAMATPQSEAAEIYANAIIPDLQYAVEHLVATPLNYLGATAADGRATLAAAQAMLGRVYLTMSGYPLYDDTYLLKAAELFKTVIDYADSSGKYWAADGYWPHIWVSDNDNKYHIFEIQYIAEKNYGNPMVYPSVRKLPTTYVTIEMSDNRIVCATGLNELYKANLDTDGTYMDDRCLSTIDTTKFVYNGSKYTGDDFFIKFLEPTWKRLALGYSDISAQIVDRTYFPINYPLIRLEDVMLMYAEIVGPTTEGIEMVNRIRTRAGLAELSSTDTSDVTTFLERIDEERQKEFACEGIRWFDIVRHKDLDAVREKFNDYAYDSSGNLVRSTLLTYIARMTDNSYLYPIPDDQIKLKEGLYTQNPGYN